MLAARAAQVAMSDAAFNLVASHIWCTMVKLLGDEKRSAGYFAAVLLFENERDIIPLK